MHGKQQLITPALAACLLGSTALHLLLFRSRCWSGFSAPAQIELRTGHSAVELTLRPSIASQPAEPEPEPAPPPRPDVEPTPAPVVQEAAERSRPDPEPEKEIEPDPEPPQIESVEQDADLKQKGVETAAEQLRSFQPRYPRLSRRRGEEGTVLIALTIFADGSANNITVSQSSGYPLLDKAALSAVRRSRYRPATKNGKPIDSTIEQEFIFRLKDQ